MSAFHEILPFERPISIIDVGAAEYESTELRYRALQDAGKARLIGFEANLVEAERLRRKHADDPSVRIHPFALGDGGLHELRICRHPGRSSLLEPNLDMARRFQAFAEWMEVTSRDSVQTVRLDDVPDLLPVDYLKLDVQGAELMVLENATEVLASCSVVECEAEFLPQYVNQPLFSEIEQALRRAGFLFHSFLGYGSRFICPAQPSDGDLQAPGGQWIWSDALFVRDFRQWHRMSLQQLRCMAVLLADLYGEYDFALAALSEINQRFGLDDLGLVAGHIDGVVVPRQV